VQFTDLTVPLCVSGGPAVRRVKAWSGTVMSHLRPRRWAQLERGEPGDHFSRTDRLMMAALVRRHQRDHDYGTFAAMHRWFWSGEQATRFHDQADVRFEDYWRRYHDAIVEPVQKLIDGHPHRFGTVCEIGTGSGRVLKDLQARLRGARRYIGLDLCVDQIRSNRARFANAADPRFVADDALEWIPREAQPGWLYFTNDGVLEYFAPDALRALLTDIAQQQGPAGFALIEPLVDDYDLENERESRTYGLELSFSHPYPRLFRECGWTIRWQQDARLPHGRYLMLVAETGSPADPRG